MTMTMKAGVAAQAFARIARIVDRKATLPALQYARLTGDGQEAVLQATDLDVTLRLAFAASGLGDVLVPAESIRAVLALVPADESIAISEPKPGVVAVSAGQYSTRFQTLPLADFPNLPTVDAAVIPVTLDATALKDALAYVSPAIGSGNDKRYSLDVVSLKTLTGGEVVEAAATDSHRLAIASFKKAGAAEFNVALPAKPAAELRGLLEASATGDIQFSDGENHLFFSAGPAVLSLRKSEVQYPNYERMVPSTAVRTVAVDRDRLSLGVKRAMVVSSVESLAVTLALSTGTLHLRMTGAQAGEAADQIVTEYDGDEFSVNLRGEYVLDALGGPVVGNATVEMQDSNAKPVVVRPPKAERMVRVLTVVMPMAGRK